MKDKNMKLFEKISRRDFFKNAALKTMFAGITLSGLKRDGTIKNFFVNRLPQKKKISIKSYRNLGNTGFKVSDISFGAGHITDGTVVRYAVDCGVNYIDTAPVYGRSEVLIGEVLKEKRKEVFIATKFNSRAWRTENPKELKKNLKESLERSLKDLRTDYLDAILIHSASERRMKSDEMHEVFENAKMEGKVKYSGVSVHSSETGKVVKQFFKDDSMKILTPVYNYLSEKDVSEDIKRAAEKGTAVVAMKTRMGAYLERIPGWDKQPLGEDFESLSLSKKRSRMVNFVHSGRKFTVDFNRSTYKWVLSNPYVSTLITSFRTFDDVNNFLPASGEKFGYRDKKILDNYTTLVWNKYCRIGCDICHSYCPKGVPINDILRSQMYYENYGDKRAAVSEYSDLPKDKLGDNCFNCDAPCQKSCPYGIEIKERLLQSHKMLSLNC
ncbi:MAG: aldo/keto reductase [Candidatus Helarchaeota archaeon]|nr:aldo/keto reductase [Candidatus Helarchaeota archaeon]